MSRKAEGSGTTLPGSFWEGDRPCGMPVPERRDRWIRCRGDRPGRMVRLAHHSALYVSKPAWVGTEAAWDGLMGSLVWRSSPDAIAP